MKCAAVMCVHVDRTVQVFTARRYAGAVYAVVVCLSVRVSVCLSVSKLLNAASRTGSRTIAHGL